MADARSLWPWKAASTQGPWTDAVPSAVGLPWAHLRVRVPREPEVGWYVRLLGFHQMLENCNFLVSDLCNLYSHRLPFALATLRQPRAEALGKSLRRHAETRLHPALPHRLSVIEFRGIREVAHAELVQPFQRTNFPVAA